MDLFDHKPHLAARYGEEVPESIVRRTQNHDDGRAEIVSLRTEHLELRGMASPARG